MAQVFKPALDTRSTVVCSHTGVRLAALSVQDSSEIIERLHPDAELVAIDEGQFFDDGIVDACRVLVGSGIRVLVTGLDMDFRGEPFGAIPKLMAVADVVMKLTAQCAVCGSVARFTQHLINGQPARVSDPITLIGGSETYQPRCRIHHQVPGREFHWTCAARQGVSASSMGRKHQMRKELGLREEIAEEKRQYQEHLRYLLAIPACDCPDSADLTIASPEIDRTIRKIKVLDELLKKVEEH